MTRLQRCLEPSDVGNSSSRYSSGLVRAKGAGGLYPVTEEGYRRTVWHSESYCSQLGALPPHRAWPGEDSTEQRM